MRKNDTIPSSSRTHQEAPGPRGDLKLDDAHNVPHDPLHFLLTLTRQYGDLVQDPSAYGPVYLVNHPDYIGRVL